MIGGGSPAGPHRPARRHKLAADPYDPAGRHLIYAANDRDETVQTSSSATSAAVTACRFDMADVGEPALDPPARIIDMRNDADPSR